MSRTVIHNFKFNTLVASLKLVEINLTMSKRSSKIKAGNKAEPKSEDNYVTSDKSNNILLNILAKPGAKQNKITGVSIEGVGVQINAPPADGEANSELVKFISSVLGVRKSDVNLERGFKSRQKTLKITSESITIDEIKQRICNEIETQ